MNTNGVHCHVSPMIDGRARQPRVGDPGEVPQPELDPQRLEGPLRRVGHHQEHVADPDRRDRQRDQEHDPEELAPRDLLDGQQREPEAEAYLERDPGEHEDQGDDQRARAAAVAAAAPAPGGRRSRPAGGRRTGAGRVRTARPAAADRRASRRWSTSTIVAPTTSQPSRLGGLSTPRKWLRSRPNSSSW